MMEPFGARLVSAINARGPLCVGIDPHPGLLQAWDLPATVSGLERFAMTVVEALGPTVAVLKPRWNLRTTRAGFFPPSRSALPLSVFSTVLSVKLRWSPN